MLIQQNYVQKAVDKVGGPTMVSNHLAVSNGAVHKWTNTQRIPNLDKAKKLAELSKVAVEKLRPV